MHTTRCCWEGCWRSTTQPYKDGWSHLFSWPPPIQDGFYCQAHADAIEAVSDEGRLEEAAPC
jgi:hypothetical protein